MLRSCAVSRIYRAVCDRLHRRRRCANLRRLVRFGFFGASRFIDAAIWQQLLTTKIHPPDLLRIEFSIDIFFYLSLFFQVSSECIADEVGDQDIAEAGESLISKEVKVLVDQPGYLIYNFLVAEFLIYRLVLIVTDSLQRINLGSSP